MTDGKEHRVSRTNKHVCQLCKELYTPFTILKLKTKGVCTLLHACYATPKPKVKFKHEKNFTYKVT